MASEVRYAEVRRFLERHGWTHQRTKGSHHHFRKEGQRGIGFPVHHGRVGPVYIRQIEKIVGEKLA